MLFLNNDDVRSVLTMDMAVGAIRQAYQEIVDGEGICRPRMDIRMPTKDPNKVYRWASMEGGSPNTGYFAIRFHSNVLHQAEYEGVQTHEMVAVRPGMVMGMVLLIDTNNAEPLALINDGFLQRMRVGADSAIGAELMAREDSGVVGILGSGGMARSHIRAFCAVRPIRRLQVYSPTPANREQFAREVRQEFEIETVVCDNPADVYHGADILAACTDGGFQENPGEYKSAHLGRYLEPGTHVTSIWGRLDDDTTRKIDIALVLGTAPAPQGYPELRVHDTLFAWSVPPDTPKFQDHHYHQKSANYSVKQGNTYPIAEKTVYMEELLSGQKQGRTSPEQVTFSDRGNLQGAQFHSVAGRVYEAARSQGLGREIPTEWFLQSERD